jgi:trans-aconitate 2-methyltransferase
MDREFDGRKYEKASAHQKEWGTSLIADLHLQGTEHVLDLGCGDGVLTSRLADLLPGGQVVGIDSSRGMINTAQTKMRENLRFLLMDINDLNFREEFDVVFSNATLHWVKDHRRLYENVGRALRPGGWLRFNFAGDGNCAHFVKVIREAMSQAMFSPCFADFPWPWYMPGVDKYAGLVEASGLQAVHVWSENADRFFPEADVMIRWIDQPSLVPFLTCVPEDRKKEFRDYVVRRMIEETKQNDGRCFETFRRINVSARR